MKNATDGEKLHGCPTYRGQLRNSEPGTNNREGNGSATGGLKALANKVLERNSQSNSDATADKNRRNNGATNGATVADQLQHGEMFPQDKGPAVVNHGRTFRQCSKCKRLGWYPQATAEICCGFAMVHVDHPTMTVDDYVRFIGCPKSYESGAITIDDVLAMMEREHIQPIGGEELP